MSRPVAVSNLYTTIAREDLERFLTEIDCLEFAKRLKEDGIATLLSIPQGETFTTLCEKLRQIAFSDEVGEKIKRLLTEKVEACIISSRISLALSWLNCILEEVQTTTENDRKSCIDDFVKQFFEQSTKIGDGIKVNFLLATYFV